jgi:hypothetical protein
VKDAKIIDEQMNKTTPSIIVDLRVPGRWPRLGDLIKRLPQDCRVTPQALILPDGARIELGFCPPDNQFPGMFRSSCRQPPTEKELATADGYRVNVTLSASGGSMEAARTIMKAAATMVRAGGAGVFIDNSVLAHGGELWLEMTEDGGIDALSFAFVGIVQGNKDIWTTGMHVLGLRDIVLQREDVEKGFDVVELIRYIVRGDNPVDDGHILADVNGPWFTCRAVDGDPNMVGTPMHNPFGRLRLVKLRHIAGNTLFAEFVNGSSMPRASSRSQRLALSSTTRAIASRLSSGESAGIVE